MTIKALVAVRSGSLRVKNKNLRLFAGSNLLTLKLEQLKRIKLLDGIIVNSNDDTMLEMARSMGCEAVKRDEYYASNSVIMSEVYRNMAENAKADVIAYINVTNPLLEDDTITRAIEEYCDYREEFDSLNSAHLVKEFMFQNGKPLNYDLRHQPRSQDLPDIAALNFAVNVLERQTMIDCMNVVGRKPRLFIIDELEASDIDNPIDFDFTEFVYKQKLSGEGTVLNKIYDIVLNCFPCEEVAA